MELEIRNLSKRYGKKQALSNVYTDFWGQTVPAKVR